MIRKLFAGALSLALLAALLLVVAVAPTPASAMASLKSILSPSNVAAACTIAQAVEATVLADESLANQVAGKTIVRTGTTTTIEGLTPTLCAQIQAAAALAAVAATTVPAK
jgi:hypothetical protein